MQLATVLVSLSPLLGLTLAAPTPAEVAPRCGTTYYPTILQQLSEDTPTTVGANTVGTTNDFHVQRTVNPDGTWSNRIYQLVGFTDIAPGSYGCQLAISFPAAYPLSVTPSTQTPQLNVTTLLNGRAGDVVYPNDITWSSIQTHAPGQGLFGTVTPMAGGTAVINSEACDTSLAFLFEIAVWESFTASVQFTQQDQPIAGVYLTANC